VVLALKGLGVWSLVICSLTQSAFLGILAYAVVRHPLSLRIRWVTCKPLFSFGSRISIISFLEFLGSQLDKISIGRWLGAAALGFYDRAFLTANLPISNLSMGLSKVLFPAFSRIQSDYGRLRGSYLSTILLSAATILPICAGICGASREIVLVLLGPKWIEAVPALQVLAIAAAFNFLSMYGGTLCDAIGALTFKAILQVTYIGVLLGLFYSLWSYGIQGFALAVALGELIRHVAYTIFIGRTFDAKLNEFIRCYLPGVIAATIIGSAVYLLGYATREALANETLSLALEIGAAMAIGVFLFFWGALRPMRKELALRVSSSGILTDVGSAQGRFLNWVFKVFLTV
jgi:O-antigen/teichoic acid export membrane protein